MSFTVKASGKQLSYQWQYYNASKGAWENMVGKTSATLTLEATSGRSGCRYRCRVKNPVGTVYSNAATLTALAKPVITTQPQSKTAVIGANVSFTVKASGKQLSYQWQYYNSSKGAWENMVGKTSATLTLEATSGRSGCRYRCKITNPVGTVYTNDVVLSVVK